MSIFNLPQRSEENINNNTSFSQESIVPDGEIPAQLLSEENLPSFVQFAFELGKLEDYDFAPKEGNSLVSTVDEHEDWFWVEMTDEFPWQDEEERSELAELEEERLFYTAKMRL